MTKGQHYRNILHVFAVNCLLLLNVYPGPLTHSAWSGDKAEAEDTLYQDNYNDDGNVIYHLCGTAFSSRVCKIRESRWGVVTALRSADEAHLYVYEIKSTIYIIMHYRGIAIHV